MLMPTAILGMLNGHMAKLESLVAGILDGSWASWAGFHHAKRPDVLAKPFWRMHLALGMPVGSAHTARKSDATAHGRRVEAVDE